MVTQSNYSSNDMTETSYNDDDGAQKSSSTVQICNDTIDQFVPAHSNDDVNITTLSQSEFKSKSTIQSNIRDCDKINYVQSTTTTYNDMISQNISSFNNNNNHHHHHQHHHYNTSYAYRDDNYYQNPMNDYFYPNMYSSNNNFYNPSFPNSTQSNNNNYYNGNMIYSSSNRPNLTYNHQKTTQSMNHNPYYNSNNHNSYLGNTKYDNTYSGRQSSTTTTKNYNLSTQFNQNVPMNSHHYNRQQHVSTPVQTYTYNGYNVNSINTSNNNNNSNNNNSAVPSHLSSVAITPEMLSVANTSTMSAFANDNVCKQINSILSGPTTDPPYNCLPSVGSFIHDVDNINSRNNAYNNDKDLNWVEKNMPKKIDVEEAVDEILRATGFDRLSSTNNYNSMHYQQRMLYLDRNCDINNGNLNNFSIDEHDMLTRSTHNSSPHTNLKSRSARASSSNNPTSSYVNNSRNNVTTHYITTTTLPQNFDITNGNTFCSNNNDKSNMVLETSAIDLSISSDEDMKLIKYNNNGHHHHIGSSSISKNTQYHNNNVYYTKKLSNNDNNTANVILSSTATKYKENTSYESTSSPSFSPTTSTSNQNMISEQRSKHMIEKSDSITSSSDVQNVTDILSEININDNVNIVNIHNGGSGVRSNEDTFSTISSRYKNTIPPVPHESMLTRMSSTLKSGIPSSVTTTTNNNMSCVSIDNKFFNNNNNSVYMDNSRINNTSQQHLRYNNYTTNDKNDNVRNSLSNINSGNNQQKQCDSNSLSMSTTTTTNNNSNNYRKGMYSRKVFVGGLPQDITETQISTEFRKFGDLIVDWPHKLDSNSGLPPKGYAFLLFVECDSVKNLIRHCTKIDDKFFWSVSSQRSESKQVQIRPWTLTDSIWSLRTPIIKPIPRCRRTVFVGGIPRQAQARELFENMNCCFGGVELVEIDVDVEYCYPKGAASVTFDNIPCYVKALEAHFITLKLCGMEKRVEIKPFFSDDQQCEDCGILMNSRAAAASNHNNSNTSANSTSNQPIGQCFCIQRQCLKYFCDNCWIQHQLITGHGDSQNKPGSIYHRQFQFKRGGGTGNIQNNNSSRQPSN